MIYLHYIWPPSIKFDHGCRVCWIVAASCVAVETDMGEAIFAAKVVFVYLALCFVY